MYSLRKAFIMYAVKALHYAVMLALFVGGWWLFYRTAAMNGEFVTNSGVVCALYALLLYLFGRLYDAYNVGICRIGELLYSQILANLVSLGITYVFVCILARGLINPVAGIGIAVAQTVFSIIWVLPANKLYFILNAPKDTLIIYRSESDLERLEELRYFTSHWSVVKRIRLDEALSDDSDNVQSMPHNVYRSLIPFMEMYSTIFISGVDATLRNGIVKYCVEHDKDCFFVPHIGDIIAMGSKHMRNFAIPICLANRAKLTPGVLFFKRCFDLLLSLIGIIVFSPIMLIVAVSIKCNDGGTVFYRQERLTKDGKVFNILKFRSMRMDAEQDGKVRLASCDDKRITSVGKIIRAIRLDELPQLFNILCGDMSIVGPRPERPEIAEQYEKILPTFSLRLQVKAGLTGYAQVYGRYNSEPQDKLKLDLMYINRISMFEDLRMIFATVKILFMRESSEGVAVGQVTASKQDLEKSA